ncbi:hypothetical protein NIES2109_30110 [Nostoc sp. HK-01]|nr:hypothetical protein NIES2109_30110 [Nostoc sp. HK-01]
MDKRKPMKLTPTVAEVKLFGKEIGIENIPIFDGYEEWWNVLHEIGHYAVKSDAYIQLWQKLQGATIASKSGQIKVWEAQTP